MNLIYRYINMLNHELLYYCVGIGDMRMTINNQDTRPLINPTAYILNTQIENILDNYKKIEKLGQLSGRNNIEQ